MPLVAGNNLCSATTSVLVVPHCGQPRSVDPLRLVSSHALWICTGQTKHTHLSSGSTASKQMQHWTLERACGGVRLLNLLEPYMVRLWTWCCKLEPKVTWARIQARMHPMNSHMTANTHEIFLLESSYLLFTTYIYYLTLTIRSPRLWFSNNDIGLRSKLWSHNRCVHWSVQNVAYRNM